MLRRTFLLAISVCCLTAPLSAQSLDDGRAAAGPVFYGQSSTLQEGVQHGYADVLRADGSRSYDLSRAAGKFEDAREKWLKNRQQSVQQYFELRLMNQTYRRALNGNSAPKTKSPEKSTPSSVSPAASVANPAPILPSGQIEWPAALQTPTTRDARQQLEQIFRLRATGYDIRLGTPQYRQANTALAQLTSELQTAVRTIPSAEYVAAKKVLNSLKRELTLPVQQPLLSQN